ncbi:hypothetical protein PILCRDRAFT_85704 [Piloderma croceum F 1598]|uniref:Uncharacterized protein n=1 Tax=Piloderma croceum (strain F 1598) TaxID=765440 RepID=A0A0C3G7Z7_PILCF|nr:hypothetical protein PILCRDRAFT_85704 [Piloderma croceum F 1598]
MGSIFSAIGGAIEAVISAIAGIIMTIVGVITMLTAYGFGRLLSQSLTSLSTFSAVAALVRAEAQGVPVAAVGELDTELSPHTVARKPDGLHQRHIPHLLF